jgi:hypothetical protein
VSIAARLWALEQRRESAAACEGTLFTWTDEAGAERAEVLVNGEIVPLDQYRRRFPGGTLDKHYLGVDPHRI